MVGMGVPLVLSPAVLGVGFGKVSPRLLGGEDELVLVEGGPLLMLSSSGGRHDGLGRRPGDAHLHHRFRRIRCLAVSGASALPAATRLHRRLLARDSLSCLGPQQQP